jgi:hypothetical protein
MIKLFSFQGHKDGSTHTSQERDKVGPLFLLLLNIVLEFLVTAIRQKKEIKET